MGPRREWRYGRSGRRRRGGMRWRRDGLRPGSVCSLDNLKWAGVPLFLRETVEQLRNPAGILNKEIVPPPIRGQTVYGLSPACGRLSFGISAVGQLGFDFNDNAFISVGARPMAHKRDRNICGHSSSPAGRFASAVRTATNLRTSSITRSTETGGVTSSMRRRVGATSKTMASRGSKLAPLRRLSNQHRPRINAVHRVSHLRRRKRSGAAFGSRSRSSTSPVSDAPPSIGASDPAPLSDRGAGPSAPPPANPLAPFGRRAAGGK